MLLPPKSYAIAMLRISDCYNKAFCLFSENRKIEQNYCCSLGLHLYISIYLLATLSSL